MSKLKVGQVYRGKGQDKQIFITLLLYHEGEDEWCVLEKSYHCESYLNIIKSNDIWTGYPKKVKVK